MIGTVDVQKAIFTVLDNSDIVADGCVVDGPASDPDKIEFPYIQIGPTQTLDDDLTGRAGVDEYLTLDIWSRHRGQIEVKELAASIEDLLHAKTLPIAGFSSVNVFVRDLRVFTDPDGLTQHGVLTLRIHAFGQ